MAKNSSRPEVYVTTHAFTRLQERVPELTIDDLKETLTQSLEKIHGRELLDKCNLKTHLFTAVVAHLGNDSWRVITIWHQ